MTDARYELDHATLQDLYAWVDSKELSRPKKNIARDFSDGVLMAELVKHYAPKLVELHNYISCSSTSQKKENWRVLNTKVFRRMNFELTQEVVEQIVDQKPGVIERVLLIVRDKLDACLGRTAEFDAFDYPEADQAQMSSSRGKNPKKAKPKGNNKMQKTSSLQNVSVANQFVSRLDYEEKVQECLARDETIEILHAKIRRLEHLLQLKSECIQMLHQKLDELRPTGQKIMKPAEPKKVYKVHRNDV